MRKAIYLLMSLALATPAFHAFAAEGTAKADEAAPAKEKKDKKKTATHKITQSESYMMIEPFYATIMDGSRPLGLLMVGFGLDIPNAELRDRVEQEMPRLRDAYVRSLMAFAATNVRAWRQPDVSEMADRLQGVTDRYLARKGARVLLAQVMIRLNK
jgi:flagellar basal body-associated protein FliL